MKGGEKVNLGIMHLTKVNMNQVSQTKPKNFLAGPSSNTVNGSDNKFGNVFNKIMKNQSKPIEEVNSTVRSDADSNGLSEFLEAESVEKVLDLLGITHDEGLFMIASSSGQSAKSIDELMNLEDLLSLVGMNQDQLQNVLEQLLGNEQSINDIWQLIQFVNEQAPNFVGQITTAFQSQHGVSPKEAKQLVQLLKLAQMIGENSDLLNEQPTQLGNLKDVLKDISHNLGLLSKTTESSTLGNNSLQSFQKVTKHLDKNTDQQPISSSNSLTVTSQKTVSITLPVEKSAQGEALVKEIQQLMNRSQLSNSQGTMKLLLKLYPENLGSIRIEIMQKDGVLSARLLASTPQAKELLEGQINQLKTSFTQANIQMDRIDIAQSLQDPDRNLRDQNLFSNLFKQQQEQENDDDNNPKEDEERMSFQDYLINEEV